MTWIEDITRVMEIVLNRNNDIIQHLQLKFHNLNCDTFAGVDTNIKFN